MKISAVTITNFKRVRDVRITPDADRTVILLGGKNAQGKSSTLDALNAAFGGKRALPADPVRHGAEAAEIKIELDGGELTVRRVIQPNGESTLEVRDTLGAVKSPQAALDKLIGARFLDPIAFLALPAKEQRAQLMRMIEGAERIAGLDEKRGRVFDKRTEVGRDLTRAEGELARLPAVAVGQAIDVAALTAEKERLVEQQRAGDALANAHAAKEREASNASAKCRLLAGEIAELERRLADKRAALVDAEDERATAERLRDEAKAKLEAAAASWAAHAPRRAELDAQLASADAHNRAVFAAEAQAARRKEAEETVGKLKAERDNLTAVLATIDQRKAEILAAAKLPVEGLSVDAEGITLAGVPFGQASAAERLRVALALAVANSPGLDDIWIRDGALFDEDHLELVAQHAAAAGKRVWIERVGTRDPGAIVIHDGRVRDEEARAAS